jgi:hypothetical protein
MPSPTRVNGKYPSFANITAHIDGYDLGADLTAIDYKHNVDRGEVRGASRQRLGLTEGDYKAELSGEMTLPAYKDLRARLGDRLFDVVFPVTVSVATDETAPITTDELVRCRFKDVSKAFKQGTEGLMVKVEFDTDGLIENGLLPFEGFVR